MQEDRLTGKVATLRGIARAAVEQALGKAIATGALPDADEARSAEIEVSRPAKPEHGDFASNLALRLARPLRLPPLAIATALANALTDSGGAGPASTIAIAEAVTPGFLNLRLTDAVIEAVVDRARADPASWGRSGAAGDSPSRHVNVEFVSANPTGPLTVGNARGAFVGDLLSRVLEAGGQRVTREYYFNDFGRAGAETWGVRTRNP